MEKNLSVVIVTFHSEEIIEKTIKDLHDLDVVIVECSNNKKLKEKILKKYNFVNFILSSENLGYSAGNNLGIKNVKKDFALILNPDVVLEKNSMNEIFTISKEIDDFAIIAPISDKKEYPNYSL